MIAAIKFDFAQITSRFKGFVPQPGLGE
jgi:hypothetical protein